jgi:hypothetical protein
MLFILMEVKYSMENNIAKTNTEPSGLDKSASDYLDYLYEVEGLKSENIEKEAGVIGGATLGYLGGGIGGMTIGYNLANKRHPVTPEVKRLNDESDRLHSDSTKRIKHLNNFAGDISDNGLGEFLNSPWDKKIDDMTVGELEDKLYDHFNKKFKETKKAEKTASLKSTLISAGVVGIPTGIGVGKLMYNGIKDNNINADKAQKYLNHSLKHNNNAKRWENSSELPKDFFQNRINADHFTNIDPEGKGWAREELSNYAKHHGKDIRDIKMKDYKRLAEHLWENGELDKSKGLQYYIDTPTQTEIFEQNKAQNQNKKAAEIINEMHKEAKFGFGNKKQNFNAKKNDFSSVPCDAKYASEEIDEIFKEAGVGSAAKELGETFLSDLKGTNLKAAKQKLKQEGPAMQETIHALGEDLRNQLSRKGYSYHKINDIIDNPHKYEFKQWGLWGGESPEGNALNAFKDHKKQLDKMQDNKKYWGKRTSVVRGATGALGAGAIGGAAYAVKKHKDKKADEYTESIQKIAINIPSIAKGAVKSMAVAGGIGALGGAMANPGEHGSRVKNAFKGGAAGALVGAIGAGKNALKTNPVEKAFKGVANEVPNLNKTTSVPKTNEVPNPNKTTSIPKPENSIHFNGENPSPKKKNVFLTDEELDNLLNEKKAEEEKIAGAIGTFGRAAGRTLGGTMIGAGIGIEKAKEKNEQNPMNTDGDNLGNSMLAGTGGAIAGGLATGVGGHYLKKGLKAVKSIGKVASANEMIDVLFDKSIEKEAADKKGLKSIEKALNSKSISDANAEIMAGLEYGHIKKKDTKDLFDKLQQKTDLAFEHRPDKPVNFFKEPHNFDRLPKSKWNKNHLGYLAAGLGVGKGSREYYEHVADVADHVYKKELAKKIGIAGIAGAGLIGAGLGIKRMRDKSAEKIAYDLSDKSIEKEAAADTTLSKEDKHNIYKRRVKTNHQYTNSRLGQQGYNAASLAGTAGAMGGAFGGAVLGEKIGPHVSPRVRSLEKIIKNSDKRKVFESIEDFKNSGISKHKALTELAKARSIARAKAGGSSAIALGLAGLTVGAVLGNKPYEREFIRRKYGKDYKNIGDAEKQEYLLSKKAAMDVPTEEEKKKENNQATADDNKIVDSTEDNSTQNTVSADTHLKESTKQIDSDEQI